MCFFSSRNFDFLFNLKSPAALLRFHPQPFPSALQVSVPPLFNYGLVGVGGAEWWDGGGVLITCHWGGWVGGGEGCLNVTPYCWTLMAAGRSADEPLWVQLRGRPFSNHRSACTSGAEADAHATAHLLYADPERAAHLDTYSRRPPPSSSEPPLPPQPPTNPPLKQFSGGLIAFYYRPNPDISAFIKMGRYAYHELF